MIVVTGGAGFIGSNIVKALNDQGRNDIIVVDDLTDGHKFVNLVDCDIADYIDKETFLETLEQHDGFIDVIFHEGACSATTEWDGRFVMNNNFTYSKVLLHYCLEKKIPFYYASSASTYGAGTVFKEGREYEAPINMYGYSKFLFDQYVRALMPELDSPVVGLRYFNVYGPREGHKGSMASVAFHLNNQIKKDGVVRLFEGCDGYGDGEQKRDFVYVGDVVAANLWFYQHPKVSGIFNIGTGRAQPFNDVARAVIEWHGKGKLEYVPFPDHLKGHYQSFTQADLSALRSVGCNIEFRDVASGVAEYLDWLNKD